MSLDLVKCGMCGKATVVAVGHRHLCDECRDQELKLYRKVRSLVLGDPAAGFTIQEVAGILMEDEKKIHHLVDSGYFKLTAQGMEPCKLEKRVF